MTLDQLLKIQNELHKVSDLIRSIEREFNIDIDGLSLDDDKSVTATFTDDGYHIVTTDTDSGLYIVPGDLTQG